MSTVYLGQLNSELRTLCNEVVLCTTSPCLQVLLSWANLFICIDTTLSINTNVSYIMCYSMRIYIATLQFAGDRKPN